MAQNKRGLLARMQEGSELVGWGRAQVFGYLVARLEANALHILVTLMLFVIIFDISSLLFWKFAIDKLPEIMHALYDMVYAEQAGSAKFQGNFKKFVLIFQSLFVFTV